jgi:phosphoglycolate phosphatase-like HAD superfamily hydrolase
MSEARKIFPMDTFVAYLKDDEDNSVTEMLGYLTQKTLDDDFAPFAAALSKAWIYEQHPELTKMSKGQVMELGQSVSVAPMPVKAKAKVDEVFDKLADYKAQINAKTEEVEELTKTLADRDAKIAELTAKVKEFEDQKKGKAEELFVTTEARIVEFTGKLEALLKEVEEVKKTGVVVAGVAGAAATAGAASSGDGAPAEAAAGDGFGFSGGAPDPFSDANW